MTEQMERRPDTEISSQSRGAKKSNQAKWPVLVLLAIAIAGFVGVAVATHLTGQTTITNHVFHEPNANTREGRVPITPIVVEPWGGSQNANTREGRVPITPIVVEPWGGSQNANTREGRVPITPIVVEPWGGSQNANTREGRVPTANASSRRPKSTTAASATTPHAAT
jgi:hypothetical protein